MTVIKSFHVLSSDGVTLYTVTFGLSEGKLTVQCDCPAGVIGKLCKHKLCLLTETNETLTDTTQLQDYREVVTWVRKTQIPGLIEQIALSERELEQVKNQLNKQKKLLEKTLKG